MKATMTNPRRTDDRVSWGHFNQAESEGFTPTGVAGTAHDLNPVEARVGVRQHARAAVLNGSPATAAEYLNYWLDNHAAPRCQPKTLERYRQLATYLVPLLGCASIIDLNPEMIQEAINVLQLRGGAQTKAHPQGRPLAAKTVHSIASVLFTCLGDAARLAHIRVNPMANGRVKLPRRPKPNPAVMGAADVVNVFQAAQGTRLYPFIVAAASSGCRRGELLALTWADLNFEEGLMTVSKSLEQTRLGLRVKPTKSGSPRTIGLDDYCLQVLSAHGAEQQQEKLRFASVYRDNNLIFCQPNGDFYSPDHAGTRTKALLRKAGYPNYSLHSFRHSHASILLGNGVPVPVVSERLGHANPNITLAVYSHALSGDRRTASRLWHTVLSHVMAGRP